jgi:hypothetical protein
MRETPNSRANFFAGYEAILFPQTFVAYCLDEAEAGWRLTGRNGGVH